MHAIKHTVSPVSVLCLAHTSKVSQGRDKLVQYTVFR